MPGLYGCSLGAASINLCDHTEIPVIANGLHGRLCRTLQSDHYAERACGSNSEYTSSLPGDEPGVLVGSKRKYQMYSSWMWTDEVHIWLHPDGPSPHGSPPISSSPLPACGTGTGSPPPLHWGGGGGGGWYTFVFEGGWGAAERTVHNLVIKGLRACCAQVWEGRAWLARRHRA